MNKRRFQTLSLTFLCQSVQAVSFAGLPLLLPLIRKDLGLTFSQAGSLASASLLAYALMQIPAGYLSDRYSPRKLVTIGTLGMMGLSILLGYSHQFWQLLGIQFFWGFFSSFIFTPAMSVYAGWFSSERRTVAMTLSSIGPSIGSFAINLIFPIIANRYETWRLPFIIFGIIGIIFALSLLLLGKDSSAGKSPAKLHLDIVRELFRYKQVWLCYILQFIRFGVVQGIGFWLPSLLINEKQFPLQLAGAIVALQTLIMAPSNIVGGYFSERSKKPTFIIGLSMVMLGITTMLLVNLNSIVLIAAVVFINAIFLQMYFGPLFNLPIEKLGPDKIGISNGVSNMFAIFGGLVSAYLMGVLKDTTSSFKWGFYSIGILCAIGLILTFILEKVRRAEAPETGRIKSG